ncbi:MAG TPA: DUF2207 domain-containing protein [Propionibacteriaceae bacterium]|nr:DUF2207 domain-containing protein [Propionibacteriaceae bacterium]
MRRRLATLLAAVTLGLLGAMRPDVALAASDQFDSWTIDYIVRDSGVVHVTETLVYRFGSNSGRHGIERSFVTREAWGTTNSDVVYTISNLTVESPNAPDMFSRKVITEGRNEWLTVRVGSANQTVTSATATYTLTYDVGGGMRDSSGYDEFYWDAISGETPLVKDIDVTVEVPGGVQEAACYSGPPTQTSPCTSSQIDGGKATFTQDLKPAGHVFTIGARIKDGLVADNSPHLETRSDATTNMIKVLWQGLGALSLVVSPFAGWAWYRRRGRDRRYVGVPPGVIPGPGEAHNVGPSDPRIEIPVAFSPPRIPVAEAGLLVDGRVDTRETTATLVDLAVRGAIQLRSEGRSAIVREINPHAATAPHEQVLLAQLFSGHPRGAEVDVSSRGSIVTAHEAVVRSVRNQVASRQWFTQVPSVARRAGGLGLFWTVAVGFFFLGGSMTTILWASLPLIPIVVTIIVVRAKTRRGQRTALGRAVTDQIEGFRLYLATAEADQIRFEEGEDIFSKYLPWAIVFDLAERWAKICSELVAMGRLPQTPPGWYYGGNFNYFLFNDTIGRMDAASTPMPTSVGTSGSGFGSGSSFGGGGGFSGGGGGGGGAGGW